MLFSRLIGKGPALCVAFMIGCGGVEDQGRSVSETDVPKNTAPPPYDFEASAEFSLDSEPTDLLVTDLNQDGHADLLVCHQFGSMGGGHSIEAVSFRGLGDGTFEESHRMALPSGAVALEAGDLDGDSTPDLVFALETGLHLLLGAGESATTLDVGPFPADVALADLDRDGHLDLVTAVPSQEEEPAKVVVWSGSGNGLFPPTMRSFVALPKRPSSLAIGDFDGDGHRDIAVSFTSSPGLVVIQGQGDGTFAPAIDAEVEVNPFQVTTVRINGDQRDDLAMVDMVEGRLVVMMGGEDLPSATRRVHGTGKHPFAVAATDLNGDQETDLVVSSPGNQAVIAHLGDGTGAFTTSTLVELAQSERLGSIVAEDFNSDGRPDLAVIERGTIDQAGLLHLLLAKAP